MRPKLVVNEPTLPNPTAKQILVTGQSVVRSKSGCPLETPGEQVPVRCFTERLGELPAEMSPRQAGHAGHVGNREGFEVAGVRQVFCPQEVAGARNWWHLVEVTWSPARV
jgi:hypothetical protein